MTSILSTFKDLRSGFRARSEQLILTQHSFNPVYLLIPAHFTWQEQPWPGNSSGPARSLQWCPTLCDPMGHSPPGSSIHGTLQARILKQVACPPPGNLFDPEIERMSPTFLHWQSGSLPLVPLRKHGKTSLGRDVQRKEGFPIFVMVGSPTRDSL